MREKIIDSLKQGYVPPNYLFELTVGKEEEIHEFQRILTRINNYDSSVKFICSEYGGGKSHFLKLIEKLALDNNFVVSYVKILPTFHSNLNNVYHSVINSIQSKNGNSLDLIFNKWIAECNEIYLKSIEDTEDYVSFNEWLYVKLYSVRQYSHSFAEAIEYYCRYHLKKDYPNALSMISWLSLDVQFQENQLSQDINIFEFLSALSSFIKLAGYSGLVILFDDMDSILDFSISELYSGYDCIKRLIEYSNDDLFQSLLTVFSVTPELLENDKKGIPIYESLNGMINNTLATDLVDFRTSIVTLTGFDEEDLRRIAGKLSIIHDEAYNWRGYVKINPILDDIIDIYINNAGLTGGKVNPRFFIRSFIRILDTVQQNQSFFENPSDILEMFKEQKRLTDDLDFDEIDEFDDEW